MGQTSSTAIGLFSVIGVETAVVVLLLLILFIIILAVWLRKKKNMPNLQDPIVPKERYVIMDCDRKQFLLHITNSIYSKEKETCFDNDNKPESSMNINAGPLEDDYVQCRLYH